MAGPALDRELAAPPQGRLHFALADERDEAGIRRLLRANPMHGAVSLSFEREPNYFLGCGMPGAEDQTVVAFERERLVCMGRGSVRARFLNGSPHRVGYLGELRLDASAQGRFDILRRGYQFFLELHKDNPPATWFTSIAADNLRSIRFLERNLRGMPRYEFCGEYVTLLIPVPRQAAAASRLADGAVRALGKRGFKFAPGDDSTSGRIVALLNRCGQQRQFAVAWTPEQLKELKRWGLSLSDVLTVMDGSRAVACAVLWDQRGFRQTVIRDYSRRLSWFRPFINLAATAFGNAGLPAVGSLLAHAFLSPLAIEPEYEELLVPLVGRCLALAQQRQLDYLTLGFAAGDAALVRLRRRFRCREYRSRLYHVAWPGVAEDWRPDGRLLAPEVALL